MNTSADAADQVVRMSLNGAEFALKVTGKGSIEAAKLLTKAIIAASKETNKTKGAIRLNNLIRSGRKLDIARIPDADLKQFCTDAKHYGILYTVLKNKNSKDGVTEIMFKSDDREKFNMIFSKLGKDPAYMAQVKEELTKEAEERAKDAPPEQSLSADAFVDKLMEKPEETRSEKEGVHKADPSTARTSSSGRSEPISERQSSLQADVSPVTHDPKPRKSVRKELEEIKAEMERNARNDRSRTQTKTIQHKDPGRKKKLKRNKER
ncbi:MAG: PcfB family protein [Lachnospiraceae bacterium]|nr:PcfB family protein [Lachnospiraceae bacterium]